MATSLDSLGCPNWQRAVGFSVKVNSAELPPYTLDSTYSKELVGSKCQKYPG